MSRSPLLRPLARVINWLFILVLGATTIAIARAATESAEAAGTLHPTPRVTALEPSVPQGLPSAAAACTAGSYTRITPCPNTVTSPPSATGRSLTLYVQNSSGDEELYAASCTYTAPVTSCSHTRDPISVSAGGSRSLAVTYNTSASSGTGTINIRVVALMGNDEARATTSVTVDVPRSVTVIPDNAATSVNNGSSSNYVFQVKNTGGARDTFNLSATCTGSATCVGTPTPSVLELNAGVTGVGTVNYTAGSPGTTGLVKLTATRKSTATVKDSGWVNVTVPHVYSVSVTPDAEHTVVSPSTSYSGQFTVRNTGSTTESFDITRACPTGVTCGMPSITRTPSLTPNATSTVTLGYTVGALPYGSAPTITVTATEVGRTTVKDDGSLALSVQGPQGLPTFALADGGQGTTAARDLCLSTPASAAGAYECGDLRLVHPLPPLVTYNKVRAPVLLYNSQHARPYPLITADVTIPVNVRIPDQVAVTLTVGARPAVTTTFVGRDWTPGSVRRVAVGFDASGDSTGLYPYTLQVENVYGFTRRTAGTLMGELAVVNRANSYFGAGWWLSGYERLVQSGSDIMLWVGGDGSTRKYTRVPSTSAWVAPSVTRPDTIKQIGTEYVRYLRQGVTVTFDGFGRHVRTTDRLQHTTRFVHASGKLDTIRVPMPGSSQNRRFAFRYLGATLDTVTTWAGDSARRVRLQHTNARVDRIIDPDERGPSFGYDGTTYRITSRTDERLTVTTYAYDPAKKLSEVSVDLQTTPASVIRLGFQAAESRGFASGAAAAGVARDTALVYTRFDGPRAVPDTALFWLDRFGAPRKVVNALGHTTVLDRGNSTFPALVTRFVGPTGFTQHATYTDRGNLRLSIQDDVRGDGVRDTTWHDWSGKWDALIKVVPPERDSVVLSINATTGQRDWQQDARGDSTRVEFFYNGFGLLSSIRLPSQRVSGGDRDSIEYDPLTGNLSAVRTPLGAWTRYSRDPFGREQTVTSPIDGTETLLQRTTYDILGRPTLTEAIGSDRQLYVETRYDSAGNVDRIRRWTDPAPNVDVITTRWVYDRANRKIEEIAPDNEIDRFAYDSASNLVSWKTRRNHIITYRYDALNRLTERHLPSVTYTLRVVDSYIFPMNGQNLVIPADVEVFDYDALGNVIVANNADAKIHRAFFPNGSLRSETQRIRAWDGTDTTMHVYTLRFAYDRNGRRIRLWHPEQFAVPDDYGVTRDSQTYAYGPGGQLTLVRDIMSYQYKYFYDADSRLDSIAYPGDVFTAYRHDPDGRLRRRNTIAPRFPGTVGDTLYADTLVYDLRAKVITASTLADSVVNIYDNLGALKSQERLQRPIGMVGEQLDAYVVDALGNQTSANYIGDELSGESTYEYERGTGRLVRSHTQSNLATSDYNEYDPSGNRHYLHRTEPATGVYGTMLLNQVTFTYYRADQKPVLVDKRTSAHPAYFAPEHLATNEEFRYDALGRRVVARSRHDYVEASDPTLRVDGSIQRFVWDGDHLLWETRYRGRTGTPVAELETDTATFPTISTCERRKNCGWGPEDCPTHCPDSLEYPAFQGRVGYAHGLGIDQPLSITRVGLGRDTTLFKPFIVVPLANWRGGYSVGTNRLGTTTFIQEGRQVYVDWTGGRLNSYGRRRTNYQEHDWFGGLIDGQRTTTGTMYMRNRHYDPTQGRFTTEDPIALAGGLNLYGYAAGDPINNADPFGLKVCFRGNARQEAIREASDAISADITVDEDGCATGFTPRAGSDAYAHLQNRFAMLMGADSTYGVEISETGNSRYDPRNRTAFLARGNVGQAYPGRGIACTFYFVLGIRVGGGRWTMGALLTHELLGHGYAHDQGLPLYGIPGQRVANAAENIYHRNRSEPLRCPDY